MLALLLFAERVVVVVWSAAVPHQGQELPLFGKLKLGQ